MIDADRARRTLTFRRGGGLEKSGVHVLAMEHVVHITPLLFVPVKIVLVENFPSLPIAHDEFHLADYG